MGFRENGIFHVLLAYDGHQTVRTIVTDKHDAVRWDSGSLPAVGGFACSRLRFDVNPYPRSEIEVNRQKSEVILRGGGGGPDSPYWLKSTLSGFRLVSSKPRQKGWSD